MPYKVRKYGTAVSRWAGLGPYYAMFPVTFADYVIRRYSRPGDVVLDPFAGRGTSLFSAAAQARVGIGVELNPVGWVYSRTKLSPAPQSDVERRLVALGCLSRRFRAEALELPEFFRRCYSAPVRRFLLAARAHLDWRRNRTDRTTTALLLVYLHGKRSGSLSNQMRQTKSMSPQYAIDWWKERELTPPDLDPVEFLRSRLRWRYAKGLPQVTGSHVYLADSTVRLPRLAAQVTRAGRVGLLFTSPPYFDLTNYHYDQWLRLWLLGGRPNALRIGGRHRGKFESRAEYRTLLESTFKSAARMMRRDGCVYVRTDRRKLTYDATRDALVKAFPRHRLFRRRRALDQPTQTRLFGDLTKKAGEVDLILLPS
jgi:hypothetical protein